MGTEKSETKVKSADLGDYLTGTAGENGEKLENGHPVTETTTKTDDDDDKDDD